ncbi:MAG: RluA family pseudouridine synthase [Phycisphaerae bacterium]|nr:RluA family pseudouridine synthase [Phycisphaerae bacterium]
MSSDRGDKPSNASGNAGDEVVLSDAAMSLINAGGKVDADALRRAMDAAGDDSDDAELRRITFNLKSDLNKRLDRYLTDRIGFMSRTQLQNVVREGGVLVNGRVPKASTLVKRGDVIEVVVPPPPSSTIQPEDIPLHVLYEDEHLIVLNKQPDIIVHPARSHLKGTMLSALAYHFRHRSKTGGALSGVGKDFARPGVVHRLDRHTSGCIVFAKQDEAHWKLGHQFEHRSVDKRYLAVVHGRIEPAADVIELPIGSHPSKEKGYREKYVVRHDELGKHAVTIYRVREWYRLPAAPGLDPKRDLDYTLVELELKTGRTHQIRVHLSYLGFPIVGDDMYTGRPYLDAAGNPIIARQALHACILGFTHPISEQRMVMTAPVRGDMGELVQDLRRRAVVTSPGDLPGATVDLAKAIPNKT